MKNRLIVDGNNLIMGTYMSLYSFVKKNKASIINLVESRMQGNVVNNQSITEKINIDEVAEIAFGMIEEDKEKGEVPDKVKKIGGALSRYIRQVAIGKAMKILEDNIGSYSISKIDIVFDGYKREKQNIKDMTTTGEYKSGRVKDKNITKVIEGFKKELVGKNYKGLTLYQPKDEADDLIYSIAINYYKEYDNTYIMSSDKDLWSSLREREVADFRYGDIKKKNNIYILDLNKNTVIKGEEEFDKLCQEYVRGIANIVINMCNIYQRSGGQENIADIKEKAEKYLELRGNYEISFYKFLIGLKGRFKGSSNNYLNQQLFKIEKMIKLSGSFLNSVEKQMYKDGNNYTTYFYGHIIYGQKLIDGDKSDKIKNLKSIFGKTLKIDILDKYIIINIVANGKTRNLSNNEIAKQLYDYLKYKSDDVNKNKLTELLNITSLKNLLEDKNLEDFVMKESRITTQRSNKNNVNIENRIDSRTLKNLI